jgi:hypothetical protein
LICKTICEKLVILLLPERSAMHPARVGYKGSNFFCNPNTITKKISLN